MMWSAHCAEITRVTEKAVGDITRDTQSCLKRKRWLAKGANVSGGTTNTIINTTGNA